MLHDLIHRGEYLIIKTYGQKGRADILIFLYKVGQIRWRDIIECMRDGLLHKVMQDYVYGEIREWLDDGPHKDPAVPRREEWF